MAQFLWYDCDLQKAVYRPCDFDDISSNSREIKYQNISRTHSQTGWKQYLATPSGAR